ncbi:MAG: PAS domain S-box protein, partial [Thermodesulfobacteriota bacterium]
MKGPKKEIRGRDKELNSYKDTLRDASFLFEDKVSELSLLKRVSNILGYILDLESFYRMFLDILMEETNAENCSFMLMDTENDRLDLKMARGRNDRGTFFDHPRESGVTFSLDEGIAGKVALERKTILVDDTREDTRFEAREPCAPIGSLLCTPLIFQEKVLGVINLSHTQPHVFSQSNRRIMDLLCALVSSIIGNAIDYIKVKDQEKFKSMFEGVRIPIVLVDPKTNSIVGSNGYAEEWLGYSKKELIHTDHIFDVVPYECREKVECLLNEMVEKNSSKFNEVSFIRKDGGVNIGEINGTMIDYQGKNIVQVTVKDVTERRKAEKEIKETKDFLERIIESSKDGIVVTDEKGVIISVNTAIEQMCSFRKKELIGKHASELVIEDKDTRKKILVKIAELFEKGYATYETIHKKKGGSYITVECNTSVIKDINSTSVAGVSIIRDITERKEMEHKLLQSEKLKSLGELAGGVAHDFNNVLAAILGRAQLLKMIVEPPPGKEERRKSVLKMKKGLEVIERASLDGAETVRRIQEFARRRDDDKCFTHVDMNGIIENSIEFTKIRWKDDAESKGIKIIIQKEFSTLPTTSGSAAELREVFTNLINNAVDAMPQGGNIRIKAFKEDSYIAIKVEDTGSGIANDRKDRIFDPFFTTKGPQSSGLGLSVSYGIIDRHRGTITVNSIEGKGTT